MCSAQGIGLALLCALGAPAIEVVLLQFVPLWHYPRVGEGEGGRCDRCGGRAGVRGDTPSHRTAPHRTARARAEQ